MANIKTSPDEWRIAREYFEIGFSLSQIVEKTGISKSQLSKVSNREGWAKETEKQQLIQKAIDVKIAKETMDGIAVSVHNSIVDERTKHLTLINNATHTNVSLMMKKVHAKKNDMTLLDHRVVQTTIKDARESLLGRDPIVNNNVNNGPTFTMSNQELDERINAANRYRSVINSTATRD